MTDLSALIDAGRSGVHRTDTPEAAGAAAHRAGWRVITLDTTSAQDKAAFLLACRQAFELPDWFGMNWDALDDSLGDVDHAPGVLVLWRGAQHLPAKVRGTAVEVFDYRAERVRDGLSPFLVAIVADDAAEARH